MIKVITPIGAVVEVEETVYENNKDTLKLYGEKTEESPKTEEAPVETTSIDETDVSNTAMESPKKKKLFGLV